MRKKYSCVISKDVCLKVLIRLKLRVVDIKNNT